MERELFTRNFMTGWVLVAGFLASWVPKQGVFNWAQAESFIQRQDLDLGALATLAIAILGTPILGYVISALVIAYLYARKGDPYQNASRWRARQVVREVHPQLATEVTEREGHRRDLFTYLIYTLGPKLLVEWGRRRHTAGFLGYNWATATVMGLVLGATLAKWASVHAGWSVLILGLLLVAAGLGERWLTGRRQGNREPDPAHFRPLSLPMILALGAAYSLVLSWSSGYARLLAVLLVVVAATMLVLGLMAEREVEGVERMWAEDYLPRELRRSLADEQADA